MTRGRSERTRAPRPGRHLSENDYAGRLFSGTTDKHPPANHAGPRRDRPTTPNTPGSSLPSRRRRRSDSRTRLRAERQLLEHHVHRDHSALVSRESCATRSVAADINTHHPATPSSHIERPKFSTSTAGETRGSVAATSDSPPPAQRTRRASRMSADLGSRACCAPADDRRSGVVIGRQEVIDLAQLLDILDNAVDDRTDRWGRRLDFNVHTMGRCFFRRRWPGIGRRNVDESGLRGLFLPAATAGHRPREHGGRDNHDVDLQFLNRC